MTTEQATLTAPTVTQARTRAMTSAEWIAFFMRDDHEQDKATPGPYEQGSGMLHREMRHTYDPSSDPTHRSRYIGPELEY